MFILRIFFMGLIAYVPSQDGTELTVLLVDGRGEYHTSNGGVIESHKPVLLARAGRCEGACLDEAEAVADFLYQGTLEPGVDGAMDLLRETIHGGGAWELNDSLLSIRSTGLESSSRLEVVRGSRSTARMVPTKSDEVEDFEWVARIGKIDPSAATVDPDVMQDKPEKGLIVGRLQLSAGSIKTYKLIQFEGKVPQFKFQTLNGRPGDTDYSQALANWIVAEVQISDCEVDIVDKNFSTGAERVMKLSPAECDGGVVEMAVMNLPKSDFETSADVEPRHASIGEHFEMYYELSNMRPPNKLRPVPFREPGHSKHWAELPIEEDSDFIKSIVPGPKGLTARPICPCVEFEGGG